MQRALDDSGLIQDYMFDNPKGGGGGGHPQGSNFIKDVKFSCKAGVFHADYW